MAMDPKREDAANTVLRVLRDQNYSKTLHKLEQESGVFFNLSYIEELALNGAWNKIDKYSSAFIKIEDNPVSKRILSVIRIMKYYQAIMDNDYNEALAILRNQLNVLMPLPFLKYFAGALATGNLGLDMKKLRTERLKLIKELVEENPVLRDKLTLRDDTAFTEPLMPLKTLESLLGMDDFFGGQPQSNGCKKAAKGTPKPKANAIHCPKAVGVGCLKANGASLPEANGVLHQEASRITSCPAVKQPVVSASSIAEAAQAAPPTSPELPMSKQSLSPLSAEAGQRSTEAQMANKQSSVSCLKLFGAPLIPISANAEVAQATPTEPPMAKEAPVPSLEVSGAHPVVTIPSDADAHVKCSRVPSSKNHALGDQSNKEGHVSKRSRLNKDGSCLELDSSRVVHSLSENSKTWTSSEVNKPSQLHSLRLPDDQSAVQVSRLAYTSSGLSILALTSDAVYKHWKWNNAEKNIDEKPSRKSLVVNERKNDTSDSEAFHCFTIAKNDTYIISSSGVGICCYELPTFKRLVLHFSSSRTATCLALHPGENNLLVIGTDDSSIHVYKLKSKKVIKILRGHEKRITGLAFSNKLNMLVSSCENGKICQWSCVGWEKQGCIPLKIPQGSTSEPHAETQVQFHNDQLNFLSMHESQLAIYEASNLELINWWKPQDGKIKHATYSCDGGLIYAALTNRSIVVLAAISSEKTLQMRCLINPSAYLHSDSDCPLVLAAHPSKRNQFAVGLSNGSVLILEPLESEGEWGTMTVSKV